MREAPYLDTFSGYSHRHYAASLSKFGTPRQLQACDGWILEREIPGTPHRDAMGSYPLFACRDWRLLPTDLDAIGTDLVSLALVPDPFGDHTPELLAECFPDVCRPFKKHFVVDLCRPIDSFVCYHHRRYAKKAFQEVSVKRCESPGACLDEWMRLYDQLIARHQIVGIPAFSRESFKRQLNTPGLVMLRAVHAGKTVGMVLWYVRGNVGYYHLGAYDQTGYRLRASFAIFWASLERFGGQLRWLNLGGAAGTNDDADDGLARFKKGWSTGTRIAYFCGRIFDRPAYTKLLNAKQIGKTEYFPVYRSGEFV